MHNETVKTLEVHSKYWLSQTHFLKKNVAEIRYASTSPYAFIAACLKRRQLYLVSLPKCLLSSNEQTRTDTANCPSNSPLSSMTPRAI
jgi:hypothetical protein